MAANKLVTSGVNNQTYWSAGAWPATSEWVSDALIRDEKPDGRHDITVDDNMICRSKHIVQGGLATGVQWMNSTAISPMYIANVEDKSQLYMESAQKAYYNAMMDHTIASMKTQMAVQRPKLRSINGF